MRIFKNAWFERFARKQKISDTALRAAVDRAEQGLVDAAKHHLLGSKSYHDPLHSTDVAPTQIMSMGQGIAQA